MVGPAVNAPFRPPRRIGTQGTKDCGGISFEASEKADFERIGGKRVGNNIDGGNNDGDNGDGDKSDGDNSVKLKSDGDVGLVGGLGRRLPLFKRHKVSSSQSDSFGDIEMDTEETRFGESQGGCHTRKFAVQWRKKSYKKNKTWDDDGIVIVDEKSVTLMSNVSGGGKNKVLGKSAKGKCKLDGVLTVGMYEVEIDQEITTNGDFQASDDTREEIGATRPAVRSSSVHNGFKPVIPLGAAKDNGTNPNRRLERKPLYDTNSEGALVMPKPPATPIEDVVDVVVDPVLSRELRPHQREGVVFLYECLMGFRKHKGTGALLADEMGLGKTLMTISVIWTLLKQSPFVSASSPVCKKVLVCCPVTLIGNWRREFKKWLNLNRIGVLTLNSKQNAAADKSDIVSFGKTKVYQVLILSYEKVLTSSAELATTDFDLLVCDEGHRLKNSSNKVLNILQELKIPRKVLLTGTPIQNDLTEFYNIIDFVNPGVLGSYQHFQKEYMKPILRAREVNCINAVTLEHGETRSRNLIELTKSFILRRTGNVISKHLPCRTDMVLFCPPTKLQLNLFHQIRKSSMFKSILEELENCSSSLSLITLFKKVCNSPSLLNDDKLFSSLHRSGSDDNIDDLNMKKNGSKINLLIPLLLEIDRIGEKTVLVSNYTQSLDLFEEILNKLNITYLRLDGSTPNNQRDSIVNNFNKQSAKENSVFLLSAKSGGLGLSLIGASRLILYDNDWNPSVDLQAMARIHREGQRKPVFIYRLMTTGCIDEKIFQRQLMKNNLSDMFLDNKATSNLDVFDMEDLKDIFTINTDTVCNTHDLIQCNCAGIGERIFLSDPEENLGKEIVIPKGWISALDFKQEDQKPKKQRATIRHALVEYKHFNPKLIHQLDCGDPVLNSIINHFEKSPLKSPLTYIFSKTSESTSDPLNM